MLDHVADADHSDKLAFQQNRKMTLSSLGHDTGDRGNRIVWRAREDGFRHEIRDPEVQQIRAMLGQSPGHIPF
jgi:hypothetical protein